LTSVVLPTPGPPVITVIRDATAVRTAAFWLSADTVAMKLGIEKTAMIRARAGISHALTEALDDGHCGLPVDELMPLAVKLLEIPQSLVADALKLELHAGTVIADTVEEAPCVFLAGLYRAEQSIVSRLRVLTKGSPSWRPVDVDKAIPWVEAKTGLALAESQKAAVRTAVASRMTVITGGPGVGKTTLVNSILRILTARGITLLLAAPTGRAARRMTETTGLEARTIHRLLEVDPAKGSFKRNEENPLDCDLLVVDEGSMIDVPLMNALLKAVPDHAALILVGDVDQLPPVGPGQPLADVIASGVVRVVHLTEIFRQAAESRIIRSAHRINAGQIPDLSRPEGERDFYFVPAEDPDAAVEKLIKLVRQHNPRRFRVDPVRDVQILCPMNRGGVGARSLNIELQQALNRGEGASVEKFGTRFSVGDKVMQIENDYDHEIYNGDIGFVESIDSDLGEIVIRFDDRPVTLQFGELDRVVLAYATTVHKSQGSEYPVVVIPVMTQHYAMLQRNLLYTAVTRGRRVVVLVGQRKAVAIAVRNASGRRRWSKLREWLAAGRLGQISIDTVA